MPGNQGLLGNQGMIGPHNAVAKHLVAMQKVLAQRRLTNDEEDSGGEASAELPLAKTPNKRQITQSERPDKKTLKRPATTRQSGLPSSLEFPSADNIPPLIYGNSKVYFAQGTYKLLQQRGDQCDMKFSFKSKDPNEVWNEVAKRLIELNP